MKSKLKLSFTAYEKRNVRRRANEMVALKFVLDNVCLGPVVFLSKVGVLIVRKVDGAFRCEWSDRLVYDLESKASGHQIDKIEADLKKCLMDERIKKHISL